MRITEYKTLLNADRQCEIVKEKSVNYKTNVDTLTSPAAIYRLLCDVFQHDKQSEECVYLLCFSIKCKLLGVFEMSRGTVNTSMCSPREIFQKALLCNASRIVLAHNHPSGDVTPSVQDMKTCEVVKSASTIMGVELLDNIIVGDDTYYSFRENGMI